MICVVCGKDKIVRAKGKCAACYEKQWRDSHPDATRQREKNRSNKKERLAKGRAYYRRNANRLKAYQSEWRKSHPVKVSEYKKRYEAKKAGLPATLTSHDWELLCDLAGRACIYCGRTDRPLVQEHATPVSMGGGYTFDNIVPSCHPCNSRKGATTSKEFIDRIISEEGLWVTPLRLGFG